MKRQFGKTLQHIAALTLGVFLVLSSVAEAAPNTAPVMSRAMTLTCTGQLERL